MASGGQKHAVDDLEIENIAPQTDPAPKKFKASALRNASAASSMTINVNITNITPLSDRGGQHYMNKPILSPDNLRSSPLVITAAKSPEAGSTRNKMPPAGIDYPGVDKALCKLHHAFPFYNFPGYTTALFNLGILTVDDIRTASNKTLMEEVGLPSVVIPLIRGRAGVLALIAEGHGVSCPRF